MQKAENKRRRPQGSGKRPTKKGGRLLGILKSILLKLKQFVGKLASKKWVKYTVLATLGLVALVVVFRLFLLVFPIKQFTIEGDTQYDINEIIDAADIRSGQRLYAIDKKEAAQKIIEECPHVKSVKIKQKFPNTVCFVIEERVAGWYVQVGDDFYALDYDLKVLLESYDEQSMKDRGLTKLVLPELQTAVSGEYPTFGNGDEYLIAETLKIIDIIRNQPIKERLTYLNLENRFEIELTVSDKYMVSFGDFESYKLKIEMIEKLINKSIAQGYDGAEINVIYPDVHSFKGYYDQSTETDKPEESEAEE